MNSFKNLTLGITATCLLSGVAFAITPEAQSQVTPNGSNPQQLYDNLVALNKAKNLARMAAERVNGGLSYYRAESAMHGAPEDSPVVDNGNGTWTFTFFGTRPNSSVQAYRSVVTVSYDGEIVRVEENQRL